jgi:hypothetical protein
MKLQLSKTAQDKVNKSVLVSGSARSGTTIIGKILHSFKDVEYAFEPEMLFSLLALIDNLPRQEWKLLFESYLYEDFFINAIAGRSINCNQNDDSSIYNVKDVQDINSRLVKSYGKIEAEENGKSKLLAYKLPDVLPYLQKLQSYYPEIRIVIMKRKASETLNSLMAKKWFADDNSENNMIWPFHLHHSCKIPYWVRENDSDAWVTMTELDRCAYYYIRLNEDVDKIKNRIEISYEKLLSDPLKTTENLATALNLEFGEKTREIIEQVKPTVKKRDSEIIGKISAKLKEEVLFYSSSS